MLTNDYLRDRVEHALAGRFSPAYVTGEIAGRYIILSLSRPVDFRADVRALTADVQRATGAHTVELVALGGQQALVIMWQDVQPVVVADPERWDVGVSPTPLVVAQDALVIGGQ